MADVQAGDHTPTRPRVVVVVGADDEAEAVARLLAASGFEVDLTSDPDAALDHLAVAGADAVVVGTDVADGAAEMLRRLRQGGGAASGAPTVVTGGRLPPADRVRTRESGADAILTKPFHIDELRSTIRELAALPAHERDRRRHEALEADRRDAGASSHPA